MFIQQQRFDFNHLLQKTCSDRYMIWNIAGNSVEMIKVIFCCHLTWPANVKIWLFSAKTALWNMIWSIAEKSSHHFVWALLEAWERFYLGLNMANTICLKHPKATTILLNFGISSLIFRRKKRVYLCYLFSYFVDVHILWLERVLRGWENFRYIRAAIETAKDFVGYLSDHAWKKDEKLSYVCQRVQECRAKLEHLSN